MGEGTDGVSGVSHRQCSVQARNAASPPRPPPQAPASVASGREAGRRNRSCSREADELSSIVTDGTSSHQQVSMQRRTCEATRGKRLQTALQVLQYQLYCTPNLNLIVRGLGFLGATTAPRRGHLSALRRDRQTHLWRATRSKQAVRCRHMRHNDARARAWHRTPAPSHLHVGVPLCRPTNGRGGNATRR